MATQLNLEAHRVVFEQACAQHPEIKLKRAADGSYQHTATQAAWWGYQEGLKAMLAQMQLHASSAPQADWPEDHSLYGEYFGTNIAQSTH